MNRGKNLRLWLVLAIAVAIAGLLGWMRFAAPPAPQGNLAGASLGGPFTLTDQNGQSVREADFAGRYRLIYFGYGFCPDVCPTDLALLGRGLKAFEASDAARGARVAPIFITIDPQRDTPAALKPFVAAFHPRLVGLTGTPDQIAAVARAYGVYAKRMETGDPENYLMDHSAMVYLYGPDGKPIGFLPHQGLTAEAITQMLATHVR
ncbi:SCO family protein [Sandarakinorhabdus cyanobacteriorum]|uniref:SCO family protein n=1 Tax=Sandarakinorhabdus cyanobacteriorum TaxID=1981098 RepID=A0A255YBZ9_9SPHN|nr:SCO family protein [Sandarakinorhabdus cyanobacteriorum]OYQ26749.1 SCO family protein [Sandarakinorhabdus cyanobacteriorum]